MTRLIDADELKKAIETYDKFACLPDGKLEPFRNLENPEMFEPYVHLRDILNVIDNAPKVEVPENAVNCVLTMFGKCSYNKTGCSDCEIKEKIRKALENEPKKGKWIDHSDETILFGGVTYTPPFTCSECGKTALNEPWWYCPNCGADMREADNDMQRM